MTSANTNCSTYDILLSFESKIFSFANCGPDLKKMYFLEFGIFPPKFVKIRPNKKLLLFWLTSFEIKVSCRKIKLWSWRYSQLDRVSRDFWCLKSASLPKFMKLTYSWELAFLKNTLCSFSTQVSPRLAQDFWLS